MLMSSKIIYCALSLKKHACATAPNEAGGCLGSNSSCCYLESGAIESTASVVGPQLVTAQVRNGAGGNKGVRLLASALHHCFPTMNNWCLLQLGGHQSSKQGLPSAATRSVGGDHLQPRQ